MTTFTGVAPPGFRVPAAAHVGSVALQIADLDRSLEFYGDTIGFHLIARHDGTGPRWARLGAFGSTAPLLELHEKRGVRSVPRRGRIGLYHFALLLPDRPALGRFLHHIEGRGVAAGAADHVFSEALYLTDPDGLQIEVYRDRPRESWPSRNGELISGVDPLDAAGVLAAGEGQPWQGVPAGSVIGHVHHYVDDLAAGEAFYHAALGLDKTIWTFPGALFLAAPGYHHHVGINIWAVGSPVATDDDARLLHWDLVMPDQAAVDAAHASLRGAGCVVTPDDGAGIRAVDSCGIVVRIRAGAA